MPQLIQAFSKYTVLTGSQTAVEVILQIAKIESILPAPINLTRNGAAMTNSLKLLRREDVQSITGIKAKSTLYKMMANGEFPPPRKLTGRAVAWLSADVEDWIKSRPLAA